MLSLSLLELFFEKATCWNVCVCVFECVFFLEATNKHLFVGNVAGGVSGNGHWLLHNRIEIQCSAEFIWHHL